MSEHYILKDPNTEPIQRRAHYDVRKAAHNYSNIGAFLAGFALASIVLISQTSQQLLNVPNGPLLRDFAATAFLIGFFGSVISAFSFAVVSAEEILAPRTHAMAFFAGTGFAVSTLFLFWGLAALTKLLLPGANIMADVLVIGIASIAPRYLILGLDDPSIAFDHLDQPDVVLRSPHGFLNLLAYVPIGLAVFLRFCVAGNYGPISNFIAGLAIATPIFIITSAWLTLQMSDHAHDERVTSWEAKIAVALFSGNAFFWILFLP